MVSLFVAVILDNLELDEDIKRLKQVGVGVILAFSVTLLLSAVSVSLYQMFGTSQLMPEFLKHLV